MSSSCIYILCHFCLCIYYYFEGPVLELIAAVVYLVLYCLCEGIMHIRTRTKNKKICLLPIRLEKNGDYAILCTYHMFSLSIWQQLVP